MAIKIRCVNCTYARANKAVSEKKWTAYECSNLNSEYHKSLLNVTPSGERQDRISWGGCTEGRLAV